MRRFRTPAKRPPATHPVSLNVRGEMLAAWVRADLDRNGIEFQFEALPHNDYQFRVRVEDKAALKAALDAARAHPHSPNQAVAPGHNGGSEQ